MIMKMISNFQVSRQYSPVIPTSHLPNPNPSIPFSKLNPSKSSSSSGLTATTKPIFVHQFGLIPRSKFTSLALAKDAGQLIEVEADKEQSKSFWAAVSLIIGTAVGPGMLGLPSATIKSGPLPSTIAILLSWVYVISSILLVAELSFAVMEEDGVDEISFTGLVTKAFGSQFGVLVSVVYASLSFSLLVACVSGIGLLFCQWFPGLNVFLANAVFPFASGLVICFFPFSAIDSANRFLCFLMLCSISTLMGIGLSVARANVLSSFGNTSWRVSSVLPAIPVTVLTLGFHVVTPFICNILRNSIHEARKAILLGGAVPLLMVLSWNLIVLGLVGANGGVPSLVNDPISVLLSVRSSALLAVQGFAFSALATSFIGYAVSFPKQLIDTLHLAKATPCLDNDLKDNNGEGRVGVGCYSGGSGFGNVGMVVFQRSSFSHQIRARAISRKSDLDHIGVFVLSALIIVPILVASFFQSAFSKALDFAGVYANCFLFGILPPLMAYIYKSRKKLRSSVVPGGNASLFLLFGIAVVLGIWH